MNNPTIVKTLFFALLISSLSPLVVTATPGITNINITSNTSTQNEPMAAINPTDYTKLVVGFIDTRTGSYSVGWSWSDNSGASWTFGANLSFSGFSLSVDPVVAFDNLGTAYIAGLAYNPDSTPGSLGKDGSIFLAKSNDGGHTFNVFQKIVAAGSGRTNDLDKPWLYINPANNDIYLTWVKRVNAWGVDGAEATTIWFARSTDGGTTFSTPIQVSTFSPATGTNRSHGPQITAVSASHIYISWHTIEAGTLPNPPTFPWRIWICESTDGGASFGPNYLVATTVWGYPCRFVSMGADPSSGRIYIAYADSQVMTPRDYDVFVTTATAASGPWTPSVRVSDDTPGSGRWQYWPSLSVAPHGRVDVIWYDERDSLNKLNIYSTSSIDGGTTWTPNIRITEAPGFTPAPSNTFAGDYNTVASANDFSYVVWMDNRTANQEIYGAMVSQSPIDAMLVLDISGSMLDPGCPGCAPKLHVLQDAVEIFVQLWNSLAVAQPQHQLGATYFRTNVNDFQIGGQVLLPIGPTNTNAASIISDVKNQTTVPSNLTAMGGGLQSAINQLTSARPRRIILFTDGMQNVNPMVVQSGAVLEIKTNPGTYNNSNISPTTPPTVLNQQLNRKISAIGVGATPQFVTLLQNIANNTGGKYYLTTAPDDNLRRFFVEQLVDALRGSSPQLIDYRYNQLMNGSATESFAVDRSARKILFKVSWKRGLPPIEIKNVEKDGVNVIGYGKLVQGEFYRIYAFDLPVDLKGTSVLPEGVWNVQLSGVKSMAYEAAVIADEKILEYEFLVERKASKVGEPLQLSAHLALDGVPVTTAHSVTAAVLKPRIGIGTALSLAPTPATVTTTRGAVGEPAASPAQMKLTVLLQQEGFWSGLQPLETVIPLNLQADGSYAAVFTDTCIPGTYSVIFRVSGEHPVIGPYTRTETRAVDVEFATADFNASEVRITRKQPLGDMTSVRIQLRPRDLHGNLLGPDYGNRIALSVSSGDVDQSFWDLLDGRYESNMKIPTGSNPHVQLTVMEQPLYSGPLSGLEGQAPLYRFALSAHVGRTLPIGSFANNFDPGTLIEADVEYWFSRTLSLNGVLGRYSFEPSLQVTGGTLYLRAYRLLGWRIEGYAEAGAGIYNPKGRDTALGISAGIGLNRIIVPHLHAELGADYWHLFGGTPKIKFIGVKAGISYRF